MAENFNRWFKFYGAEFLSDQKILALTAQERSCWLTLLCYASLSDGVIKYISEEQIMNQAGVDFMKDEWQETKGLLKHFKELGMVELSNGMITVCNWKKRQEVYSESYERLKKWREKKRDETSSNVSETLSVKQNDNGKRRIDKNRIEKKYTSVGFSKFWEEYPKKVAKGAAEKAWNKLNPSEELESQILLALSVQKNSEGWVKEKGQFIPYPASWLNGQRWLDEVKVTTGSISKQKYCGKCGTREGNSWMVNSKGGWLCKKCQ